jgi:hypothetical protein
MSHIMVISSVKLHGQAVSTENLTFVRHTPTESEAKLFSVKKHLEQFGYLDKEIRMKREQLQKMHDIRMPQASTTKPQTPDDIDTALVVLERQYISDIKRLLQLKHDLLLMINSLNDTTHRIILTEKYINFKSPTDIAAEIPCNVRTVYRWLNVAIDTLQAHYSDISELSQEIT